jgi:hypothetical protein
MKSHCAMRWKLRRRDMRTMQNNRHVQHELPAMRSASRSKHMAQLGTVQAVHGITGDAL